MNSKICSVLNIRLLCLHVAIGLPSAAAPASAAEDEAAVLRRIDELYQRKPDEAVAPATRLLEVRQTENGHDDPRTIDALYLVARLKAELREGQAAFALASKGVVRSLKVNGPKHPRTLMLLMTLGRAAREQGNVPLLRQCAQLAVQRHQELYKYEYDNSGRPATWRNDGDTQLDEMLYLDTLTLRLLRVKQSGLGLAPAIADNNAKNEVQRAALLEMYSPPPRQDPRLEEADYFQGLALVLLELREPAMGLPHAERALELRKSARGADSLEHADSLLTLAALDHAAGNPQRAYARCAAALEACRACSTAKPVHSAVVEHRTASLYLADRNDAQAEPLLRRAAGVYETELGAMHPATPSILRTLALLLARTGRTQEALACFDKTTRMSRRQMSVIGMTADTLVDHDPRNNGAVGLAITQGSDAAIAASSAQWVVNAKGIVQELALAARDDTRLGNRNVEAGQVPAYVGEAINSQISNHYRTLLLSETSATALHRIVTGARIEELDALVRKFHRAAWPRPADDPSTSRPDWIDAASIRQAIPRGAVLIEYCRFAAQASGLKQGGASMQFAAWIVPSAGEGAISIVPLGDEPAIAAAIQALHVEIKDSFASIREGKELAAMERFGTVSRTLSDLLLGPVVRRLPSGTRRLIVSPDAALWTVPWGALPLDETPFSLERFEIDLVVTGRHLLRRDKASQIVPGPPVLFGNPAYDAHPRDVVQAALRLVGQGAYSPSSTYHELPGLPAVERLAASAAEIQAIAPLVEQWTQSAPTKHLGLDASEVVFTSLRSPAAVVVSTHGFHLPDRPLEVEEEASVRTADGSYEWQRVRRRAYLQGWFNRSGLVLAGYNQRTRWDEAKSQIHGDGYALVGDGVLTGGEIAQTVLDGTRLVVLSACSTGVGDLVATGEIGSLRQVLHMAGAQNVVAALWDVPDRATAQLMIGLFQSLAAGQLPRQALRQAQLEQIKSRRDRYGVAHPVHWAGFDITSTTAD